MSGPMISEFRIAVPEADVADLRERLARIRWPRQLPSSGWERGVPVVYCGYSLSRASQTRQSYVAHRSATDRR